MAAGVGSFHHPQAASTQKVQRRVLQKNFCPRKTFVLKNLCQGICSSYKQIISSCVFPPANRCSACYWPDKIIFSALLQICSSQSNLAVLPSSHIFCLHKVEINILDQTVRRGSANKLSIPIYSPWANLENSLSQTDRQTDRQTNSLTPYSGVCGIWYLLTCFARRG